MSYSLFSRRALWPLLFLVALGVILLALSWGAPVPLRDLWSPDASTNRIARQIFFELRPPRVLAALLVGASLSVAGAGLQTLFRNPLAEPFLLGISAGGALGATLAGALRLPLWVVSFANRNLAFDAGTVFAFVGALGCAGAVYTLGRPRSQHGFTSDRARLLLVGVALSALLSALMSLVITLSGRAELAQQVAFWLLGGLGRASWPQNITLAVCFIAGFWLLRSSARDLNALRAGEEDAAALGVEIERLNRRVLIAASLLSASSVAAAGLIGFVGLLAPHIVRLSGARDLRVLLPASALFGATLLCACDALARGAFAPIEIPVGIVTSLLGVPLFLGLARKF